MPPPGSTNTQEGTGETTSGGSMHQRIILMMTLLGMALDGWMSGIIFDISRSYRAAFANGVAWNGLNLLIAIFLLSAPG
jgi:hypothetical protein